MTIRVVFSNDITSDLQTKYISSFFHIIAIVLPFHILWLNVHLILFPAIIGNDTLYFSFSDKHTCHLLIKKEREIDAPTNYQEHAKSDRPTYAGPYETQTIDKISHCITSLFIEFFQLELPAGNDNPQLPFNGIQGTSDFGCDFRPQFICGDAVLRKQTGKFVIILFGPFFVGE